jgi:hypothetical protein
MELPNNLCYLNVLVWGPIAGREAIPAFRQHRRIPGKERERALTTANVRNLIVFSHTNINPVVWIYL